MRGRHYKLISTARGLFRTVAAMIAPGSENANGEERGSRCFWEPVTDCDRFSKSMRGKERWCPGEDLNLHECYPTGT
jgi:hypothetical protein